MLNRRTVDVQDGRSEAEEPEDARVERTGRALRAAMTALLYEQAFDTITVQQIIDRAGVSRATFYERYRNKDDALHASVERMYLALESHLTTSPRDRRLVPVAELLAHFGSAQAVFASLTAADRMGEIWDLSAECLARMIERRLPVLGRGTTSAGASATGLPLRLSARMLAGALMEMVQWWLDRPERATPEMLDTEFHTMARRMLGGA